MQATYSGRHEARFPAGSSVRLRDCLAPGFPLFSFLVNLPFPLRTLILDLDGCLIDSQEGIRESVTVAARETLPGHDLDLTKLRVGPPIKIMCARAFPELPEGDLQKLAQGYRAHYDIIGFKKTHVYPGGRLLLERCRAEGVAVDIATNKPRRAVDAILAL
ncbi:MAG TPA: HAD hydrolase-like protein, partial [Verrucomicrobiae bacterium]|nr:HAD hydrolase-like protein [Verrucomicrobiae bacterium]